MTDRHCGSCTLCCKLLAVRELEKPANTRCRHQSGRGCGVYHKPGFPPSCALWNCRWLVDDGPELRRPDRSGWVVDIMPDLIRTEDKATGETREIVAVQVWLDRPEALHDPALRRYAERMARERGEPLLVRHKGPGATIIFAPSLSSDGEWHFIRDAAQVQTRTGLRLLDQLTD